jgi:AcrR family transcriptional regulator
LLVNKQANPGAVRDDTHHEDARTPRPPRPGRQSSEQRLLDAAAELIDEIGPAAVTLANIGERAGYSRGLATHHFRSKGAMMQRLVDNVTDEIDLAIFVERPKGSAADELQALMNTYFQTLRELKPTPSPRVT